MSTLTVPTVPDNAHLPAPSPPSPSHDPEKAAPPHAEVEQDGTVTDVEATAGAGAIANGTASGKRTPRAAVDIEHVYVENDPRHWTRKRKLFTLATIAGASLIATMGVNIYNPAIPDIERELGTSSSLISLSLAIFILLQGGCPLMWSVLSEFRGRKFVYLFSLALYIIGCGVAGAAKTTGVLIGMRCIQALGGSAVMTIGASTLADIFEPRERGTIVGIYYVAPLLGPSIGPLAGGILTQLLSWRATFYFLCILAGGAMVALAFMKETWRKERSLAYQSALKRHRREADKERARRLEKAARKLRSHAARIPQATPVGSPNLDARSPPSGRATPNPDAGPVPGTLSPPPHTHPDSGAATPGLFSATGTGAATPAVPALEDTKLSWNDLNPISPIVHVVRQLNNFCILLASSLFFGFTYSITYTCVLTLDAAPYSYDAFKTGFVLLSFGVGSMLGSVVGGRWSDRVRARLKAQNGKVESEDRLQSTKIMMLVLPAWVLVYAWVCQEKVSVGAIVVALFFAGISSAWMYSATLAYIVDANTGRSSSAVACNSCFRGTMAFVAAEVAAPLHSAIGDGGLYTIWAGLLIGADVLILLTICRGDRWRAKEQERERRKREKEDEEEEGRAREEGRRLEGEKGLA